MKIMMYYDGTDHAKDVLPVVIGHAKSFFAKVDVVSSLPDGNEARLDEIQGEIRHLSLRLPEVSRIADYDEIYAPEPNLSRIADTERLIQQKPAAERK